jgi:hypothetical protein
MRTNFDIYIFITGRHSIQDGVVVNAWVDEKKYTKKTTLFQ